MLVAPPSNGVIGAVEFDVSTGAAGAGDDEPVAAGTYLDIGELEAAAAADGGAGAAGRAEALEATTDAPAG